MALRAGDREQALQAHNWLVVDLLELGEVAAVDDAIAAYERDLIVDALKSARGNRARAARLLSTTERILSYKVRRYAIDPHRFRR